MPTQIRLEKPYLDAGAGTSRQEDIIWIAWNSAVASRDELGNVVSDDVETGAVGVGTDALSTASVQDSLGSGLGVLGEFALLEELRVGAKGHDLSQEGDRLLSSRMTIANVGSNNPIERLLDALKFDANI